MSPLDSIESHFTYMALRLDAAMTDQGGTASGVGAGFRLSADGCGAPASHTACPRLPEFPFRCGASFEDVSAGEVSNDASDLTEEPQVLRGGPGHQMTPEWKPPLVLLLIRLGFFIWVMG